VAKDYTTAVEPVLRPVLDPGERLLAAAPVMRDPGTTDDVSVSDELKNLLDPTILIGLGTHPGNLLQRAAFGRAVVGGLGSMARRFYEALDAATAPRVAVTEQRVVLVNGDVVHLRQGNWLRRFLGPTKEVAKLIHSVPRADILGAVPAPVGLLRRGRILVVFADGSLCALACSVPRLGRHVAATLGPPAPNAPGEENR
jgi:hypothetical protein